MKPALAKAAQLVDFGDSHNFGQKVQRQDGQIIRYYKPRPVFWEWLFFDAHSPLVKILKSKSNNAIEESIIDSIFQLKIQDQGNDGFSEALNSADEDEISDELLIKTSGGLLAYAFTFGIEDLHSGNIIVTKKGPAVIDAECVLTEMLVPNETLLLPIKNTKNTRCGFNYLIEKLHKNSNLSFFLDGYLSALSLLERNSISLQQELKKYENQINNTPIRLIFKDTSMYYEYIKGIASTDFSPEELEQIQRNDIPYFFNKISDKTVKYYRTKTNTTNALNLESNYSKMINRRSKEIAILLNNERINGIIKPNGTLFLANKFIKNNFTYSHGSNEKLSKTDNFIEFESNEIKFKTLM